MRLLGIHHPALLTAALLALSAPALAQPIGEILRDRAAPPEGPAPAAPPPPGAPGTPDAQQHIDAWLARLAAAPDAQTARIAEERVLAAWLRSGSDTVDLLVRWAMQAMEEEDYPAALDLLDAVVVMKPDFAEGWNKRATVFYLQDELGKALADIAHVLALEPLHFVAISGLGIILREVGQETLALEALRRALAIHPYLENVQDLIDELEKETGRDI